MSTKPPSRNAFLAVSAALAVALVVIAVLVVKVNDDSPEVGASRSADLAVEKEAGEAALAAARQVLVDMTTYDYKTIDDDFEWIDQITDPDLHARMTKNVKSLTRIIRSSKATAKGEVVDAAPRVVDAKNVEVLAFVDQLIKDAEHKGYKVEEQRISMTMVLDEGEWRVGRLDLLSGNNAS